jgi:hypothetical protein
VSGLEQERPNIHTVSPSVLDFITMTRSISEGMRKTGTPLQVEVFLASFLSRFEDLKSTTSFPQLSEK